MWGFFLYPSIKDMSREDDKLGSHMVHHNNSALVPRWILQKVADDSQPKVLQALPRKLLLHLNFSRIPSSASLSRWSSDICFKGATQLSQCYRGTLKPRFHSEEYVIGPLISSFFFPRFLGSWTNPPNPNIKWNYIRHISHNLLFHWFLAIANSVFQGRYLKGESISRGRLSHLCWCSCKSWTHFHEPVPSHLLITKSIHKISQLQFETRNKTKYFIINATLDHRLAQNSI